MPRWAEGLCDDEVRHHRIICAHFAHCKKRGGIWAVGPASARNTDVPNRLERQKRQMREKPCPLVDKICNPSRQFNNVTASLRWRTWPGALWQWDLTFAYLDWIVAWFARLVARSLTIRGIRNSLHRCGVQISGVLGRNRLQS